MSTTTARHTNDERNTRNMLKILNSGRMLDGLPADEVLAECPAPVRSALESWRAAVEGLKAPALALREAEARAREGLVLVRGERARYDAEVRSRTVEETDALRAAERACAAAARDLDAALVEHRDEVRRVAALVALEAHVEALDAAVEVEQARARFAAARGGRFGLRPDVDRVLVAREAATTVRVGLLEELDRVNAHALAEAAGTRLGLVEVLNGRRGVRLLTTPARAALLVGAGAGAGAGRGWALVDEEVSA